MKFGMEMIALALLTLSGFSLTAQPSGLTTSDVTALRPRLVLVPMDASSILVDFAANETGFFFLVVNLSQEKALREARVLLTDRSGALRKEIILLPYSMGLGRITLSANAKIAILRATPRGDESDIVECTLEDGIISHAKMPYDLHEIRYLGERLMGMSLSGLHTLTSRDEVSRSIIPVSINNYPFVFFFRSDGAAAVFEYTPGTVRGIDSQEFAVDPVPVVFQELDAKAVGQVREGAAQAYAAYGTDDGQLYAAIGSFGPADGLRVLKMDGGGKVIGRYRLEIPTTRATEFPLPGRLRIFKSNLIVSFAKEKSIAVYETN